MKIKHKLNIEHSVVVEVLSCIRALALPQEHLDVQDAIEGIMIDSKHNWVLDFIRSNPAISYGMHEFILPVKERQGIGVFFDSVIDLNKDEKILHYLGFNFSIEEIQESLNDQSRLQKMLSRLDGIDSEVLSCKLANIDDLIEGYRGLAISVSKDEHFKRLFDIEYKKEIQASVKNIEEELENRHPLSYAQALMGKNFWNISDWDVHEFIPVYFNSPKTVRIFNDEKNILLKALYKREKSNETLKQSLKEKLKLLSDPTRLSILRMTYMKPMYGKEIADSLKLTTATVSHHLDLLRKAGLLNLEQERHIKYFSTNTRAFNELINEMNMYIKE